MKYEMKILLPVSKIIYAGFFVVILSLVRGVSYSDEVGMAMEAPMAMLAAVFCADTYAQEIVSKRSEIQRLYPMKKRMHSIYRRMVIQEIFLFFLALIGYGLFFVFQRPSMPVLGSGSSSSEINLFLAYSAAIVITLGFWGILSNLFSCLFRNMWMGIGGCLILWIITNSSAGDRYFGAWNLFSYAFRDVENGGFSWIYGKILGIGIIIIMLAVLPAVIKKRG